MGKHSSDTEGGYVGMHRAHGQDLRRRSEKDMFIVRTIDGKPVRERAPHADYVHMRERRHDHKREEPSLPHVPISIAVGCNRTPRPLTRAEMGIAYAEFMRAVNTYATHGIVHESEMMEAANDVRDLYNLPASPYQTFRRMALDSGDLTALARGNFELRAAKTPKPEDAFI